MLGSITSGAAFSLEFMELAFWLSSVPTAPVVVVLSTISNLGVDSPLSGKPVLVLATDLSALVESSSFFSRCVIKTNEKVSENMPPFKYL